VSYYNQIHQLARQSNQFSKCQRAHDNAMPEESPECPDCGAGIIQDGDGWTCNESCGWSVSPDYETMLDRRNGNDY